MEDNFSYKFLLGIFKEEEKIKKLFNRRFQKQATNKGPYYTILLF